MDSTEIDIDLELYEEPSKQWQMAWDNLMEDEWLCRKLNRERRLREHSEYLQEYAVEVLAMEGAVVDLGSGGGELLEIMRARGHDTLGVDAADGGGGMGELYLQACRLLWQRQRLNVLQCGAQVFFKGRTHWPAKGNVGECCLVNSRGSLEQMFSDCMDGPPHHEHHDCSKLSWRMHDKMLIRMINRMFRCADAILMSGGVFLIHANGASNGLQMDMLLRHVAQLHGFALQRCEARLHKWRKR